MRLVCVALALVSLQLPLSGTAFASNAEEEAVIRTVNDYAETWNRHDIVALGSLFAADADFVPVNGRWWRGREAIQTNAALLHGTIPEDSVTVKLPAGAYGMFKACTYRFDRVEVRFIRQDVAVAHVAWTQFGDPRFKDPRQGILTFVVIREGAGWLISAAQNTVRP